MTRAAIERFWDWFRDAEPRLRAEARRPSEALLDEILAALHEYNPGLFFEIGGAPEGPFELVITAEGVRSLFPLVVDLVNAAPPTPQWRFIAFKPPQGFGYVTRYGSVEVDPASSWFLHLVSRSSPASFGMRFATPKYDSKLHDEFAFAVSISLDTVLGELVAGRDIDYLEVVALPEDPDDAGFLPLTDLPECLETFNVQTGKKTDELIRGLNMRVTSESGDFVEFERRLEAGRTADLPLIVRVRRGGFSGETESWIERTTWFAFAQDLTILEEKRQGTAQLQSMSPGELSIIIRAVDNRGHIGIEGTVGARTFDSEVGLTFSVFVFDPSQLAVFAREAREVSEALG